MYEHNLIHVTYRKATCIHYFYSILSLFGVCRLIFYVNCYSSCTDGCWGLLADDREQSHLKDEPSDLCENRGNTPLLYTTILTVIFNSFKWCFIHLYVRMYARCSQSISDLDVGFRPGRG